MSDTEAGEDGRRFIVSNGKNYSCKRGAVVNVAVEKHQTCLVICSKCRSDTCFSTTGPRTNYILKRKK